MIVDNNFSNVSSWLATKLILDSMLSRESLFKIWLSGVLRMFYESFDGPHFFQNSSLVNQPLVTNPPIYAYDLDFGINATVGYAMDGGKLFQLC